MEIGGGFRVPEIMAESQCRLIEVGTTNRTRVADYERAIDDDTALLLKVHASNYRMVGFVESTPVDALARLGPPVMVDAGSGLLDETTPWLEQRPPWLRDEPGVRQVLAAGATLVTFSGDKLLGGPQAGIIVGTHAGGGDDRAPPLRARDARRQAHAGAAPVGRVRLPVGRRHRDPLVANGHDAGRRPARPAPSRWHGSCPASRSSTPKRSRAAGRCRG